MDESKQATASRKETIMKNWRTYLSKNGFVFGDSAKYEFGRWRHSITRFTSEEEAERWLNTEEYDFREREFISLTAAKRLGWKE